MYLPANGLSDSNSSRSFFRPFCTPALSRLSRIVCSNADASSWSAACSDAGRIGDNCLMRRQALHRERSRDPDLLRVLVRPVIEQFDLGMPFDRGVDLLAGHTRLDIRVIRDRLQLDMRHALVDKSLTYVIGGISVGGKLPGQLRFLEMALGESASR